VFSGIAAVGQAVAAMFSGIDAAVSGLTLVFSVTVKKTIV
jgi:hypothetical protein